MPVEQTKYYCEFAAAFVRGRLAAGAAESNSLFETVFSDLTEEQIQELIELGKKNELKMHKFKKTMGLSRVRAVLGILHGLQPVDILDIGTGRGVFLWPLLSEFSNLAVTCVDSNPIRVRDILAVRDGGIGRLAAFEADVSQLDLPPKSFDVVTFLESLEHIPDAQQALNKAVSLAKRFIILSVPSHEDDNEEHIHLFNSEVVKKMLAESGILNSNFQYVLNHMIVVASVDG